MAPTEDQPADKRPETLLDWLNKPRPPFKDESLAPAVDRELLWRLVRDELPEDQERGCYRLIYSFRSWDQAHTEILTQHYRETNAESNESESEQSTSGGSGD